MDRKLVITKLDGKVFTAVMENNTVAELHCIPFDSKGDAPALGNIYVGRVKNIVANINAAFVEIENGVECYYSMPENPKPIFTKKIGKKPLCIGDELLVQVSKEAIKTKAPSVTSKLNFTGKYGVLTCGHTRIGASTKLSKSVRENLIKIASDYSSDEYGFIMRTNAKDVSEEVLRSELENLKSEYDKLVSVAATRKCFSCIKKAPKEYLTELKNIYQDGLTEIVVEDIEIYEEVREYLTREQEEDLDKLRLYQDKLLPLHKVYCIEKSIEDALKEYVWMKSGSYLVIQPTEALTVIDVNTGKNISKKKDDETYYKINLEAAKEAAKQIRLRNLSGIILVDFINMDKSEYTEQLLKEFDNLLKKDPISTTLVDMTKLQLVEVTRKKVRKPFHEMMRVK